MKRILLFVHYNKKGLLDKRAVYTLESLRKLYDTVVVISNSHLSKRDASTLEALSDKIIVRKNLGYDFSAWKDGMDSVGWSNLREYDSLTIMNDTCHFPLWPVTDYFERFEKRTDVDFWGASIYRATPYGMPETNEPVPEHLQSYFMTFKKRVLKSRVFKSFWNNVKPYSDVRRVIRHYETRLTAILSNQGFKYDSIVNRESHLFSSDAMINPIFQDPVQLLEQKFPFIKLKAITKHNVLKLRDTVKNSSNYDPKLINIYGKERFVQPFLRFFNFLIKNAHFTFLAISIPATIAFASITPPGFGGDEMAHTIRAYAISKGQLHTVNTQIPNSLKNLAEQGWSMAEESPWGKPFYARKDLSADNIKTLEALGSQTLKSSSTSHVQFNNTDPYPPLVYAGAVIGFGISELLDLNVGSSIVVARIMNSIPFFVLGALSLYVLRKNTARWLFFAILLLPTVISYAGTINGDPFNIAASALFIALILRYANSNHRISKRGLSLVTISALLLSFAKLPSILLVGLVFFIKKDAFKSSKDKWLKTSAVAGGAVILALLSLQVGIADVTGKANTTEKLSSSLSNPVDTAVLFGRTVLEESPDYINRAVGVIGRNGVYVHDFIILLIYVWLIVLALSIHDPYRKRNLALLIYSFGMCAVVIGLLYVSDPKNTVDSEVVFGVHGKYFTPFLALIFYSLGALSPFKITSGKGYLGIFTVILMSIIVSTSILTYTIALY